MLKSYGRSNIQTANISHLLNRYKNYFRLGIFSEYCPFINRSKLGNETRQLVNLLIAMRVINKELLEGRIFKGNPYQQQTDFVSQFDFSKLYLL